MPSGTRVDSPPRNARALDDRGRIEHAAVVERELRVGRAHVVAAIPARYGEVAGPVEAHVAELGIGKAELLAGWHQAVRDITSI